MPFTPRPADACQASITVNDPGEYKQTRRYSTQTNEIPLAVEYNSTFDSVAKKIINLVTNFLPKTRAPLNISGDFSFVTLIEYSREILSDIDNIRTVYKHNTQEYSSNAQKLVLQESLGGFIIRGWMLAAESNGIPSADFHLEMSHELLYHINSAVIKKARCLKEANQLKESLAALVLDKKNKLFRMRLQNLGVNLINIHHKYSHPSDENSYFYLIDMIFKYTSIVYFCNKNYLFLDKNYLIELIMRGYAYSYDYIDSLFADTDKRLFSFIVNRQQDPLSVRIKTIMMDSSRVGSDASRYFRAWYATKKVLMGEGDSAHLDDIISLQQRDESGYQQILSKLNREDSSLILSTLRSYAANEVEQVLQGRGIKTSSYRRYMKITEIIRGSENFEHDVRRHRPREAMLFQLFFNGYSNQFNIAEGKNQFIMALFLFLRLRIRQWYKCKENQQITVRAFIAVLTNRDAMNSEETLIHSLFASCKNYKSGRSQQAHDSLIRACAKTIMQTKKFTSHS